MQTKARLSELRVYLALRPSNYLFGRLFRSHKIMFIKPLGYVINDAKIAKSILSDGEHFSIKEAGGLGDLIAELWGITPTLLSMDGDVHKRVKYSLLELFKDESLSQVIGQELKSFATTLRKDVQRPEGVDLTRATRLATNRITMRLLGVSDITDSELLRIGKIVTGVMGCIDIKYQTFTKKNRRRALGHVDELKQVAKRFYDETNMEQDTIISRLKRLGYDGESGYGFVAMFIIAGTVTVSSSLPRIISLLVETDQFTSLQEHPELIPGAVDEGLRYTTPGPVFLHGVKKDVTLGGRDIKAGSRVIILLYNIMHDPHYTPQPFQFLIERQQNDLINGLWFGTGAHFCMGSVLAKKEIITAIEALAPFAKSLKILHKSYMHDGINPGYEQLVIKA